MTRISSSAWGLVLLLVCVFVTPLDSFQLPKTPSTSFRSRLPRAPWWAMASAASGVDFAPSSEQDFDDVAVNGKQAQANGQIVANITVDRTELPETNGKIKRTRRFDKRMTNLRFLRTRTKQILQVTDKNYEGTTSAPHRLGTEKSSMFAVMTTFNWLIDAWAFTGTKEGVDNAIALLGRMEEVADMALWRRPTVRSYTKAINAIRRSKRRDAGEVAQKLFDRMLRLYATGKNVAAKPNSHTFVALIEAYSISKTTKAAAKAEAYLDAMVQQFEEGDPEIRPSARAFCAAILAWARSDEPGAAQRAEDLLHRMEEHYLETRRDEDRPDAFSFNAVLNAWAAEGDAFRAEEILQEMESAASVAGNEYCTPDTVSYNCVIDAWAKSGDENAPLRAEAVLRHMGRLYKTGENPKAKPDVSSFNSVINAWAKSGLENAPLRAESLLELMERLHKGGNEDARPDVRTFSTVINAWARSPQPGKAERAKNLLRDMHKLYADGSKHLKPNVAVFNAVLNACAHTEGDVHEQNRAMEIAHSVLKSLEASEYGDANHVTYATMLNVCRFQMTSCESRDHIVSILFKKCCRDGQVGQLVLDILRHVTSEQLFEQLTGCSLVYDDEVTLNDLPREWSANVIERKSGRARARQRRNT